MQVGHTGRAWPGAHDAERRSSGGSSVVKPPLADGVEGEREKLEPSASVELVLELDPAREGRAIGH